MNPDLSNSATNELSINCSGFAVFPAGLTAKEIEVLRLLVQGCTNAQLARQLHRSTKTVDHHVSSILDKLGVRSRSEAIVAAFELGIATELRPRGSVARFLRPVESTLLRRRA